jgi:hypothetical protein
MIKALTEQIKEVQGRAKLLLAAMNSTSLNELV